MSNFLDRFNYIKRADERFSDGLGVTRTQERKWEEGL